MVIADLLHGELVAESVRPHHRLFYHLKSFMTLITSLIMLMWRTRATLSKEALMVTLSPGKSATLARPAKL